MGWSLVLRGLSLLLLFRLFLDLVGRFDCDWCE